MRRLLLLAALAGAAIPPFVTAPAEAACRSTRSGNGSVRILCDDGATGIMRPDGRGGYRGVLGDDPVRVPGRVQPEEGDMRSRPATGGGASGRGSREGARGQAADPCMSGGLRRTDCN